VAVDGEEARLGTPGTAGREGRLRVLLNPNAGNKGGLPTNQAGEAAVRGAMAAHGLGDELVVTASEEEAAAATRDAAERGYAVVVAAGATARSGSSPANCWAGRPPSASSRSAA